MTCWTIRQNRQLRHQKPTSGSTPVSPEQESEETLVSQVFILVNMIDIWCWSSHSSLFPHIPPHSLQNKRQWSVRLRPRKSTSPATFPPRRRSFILLRLVMSASLRSAVGAWISPAFRKLWHFKCILLWGPDRCISITALWMAAQK